MKALARIEQRIEQEREAGYVQKQWEFELSWAAGLTDKELRAAKRLKIPASPGLAVDQEHRRRFNKFPSAAAAPKRECEGHPADPSDPMGTTVYCDGSCQGGAS